MESKIAYVDLDNLKIIIFDKVAEEHTKHIDFVCQIISLLEDGYTIKNIKEKSK